ncbi:MAG TPA: T9SS type A sorting domain-containing protein [Bacteroidia bacterium]|nr:T9SS type A sorting domain-containing protein [Bacteroidia bacterium]
MNKKLYSLILTATSFLVSYAVKAQVNDLPCNAVFLPMGIYIAGNNTGAGFASEPVGPPSCFDAGGARNTVWYRFNAPATGCVKIKTVSNSLTDTQIALYSGTCGALGAELVCNNDATGCAATVYPHSQMQVCGLTPAVTYFIAVDGRANNVGSFSIMVFDGGVGNVNPFPPAPIQDCALPQLLCGTSISYPNPGFRGVGNICDHAPSNCLASGERGSAWFRLVCNGAGNIAFTIVPNNWTGGATGTDYDFGVWRIGGPTGPNFNCSTLQGNMVRCNYSAIGVTGCYAGGGVDIPGYAGSAPAVAAQIPVVAGDVLLIEISNFAISNTGFSATFTGPIATASSPGGTLVWTGTVSTDWFNINNWGGCAIPTCQTNVIIPNFTPFQPLITGQNASCRSVDVNLGASLTLNTGWQLMVCNDYLNNGAFTANNNSTVLFTDTCTVCPPVCGACAAGITHNQVIGGNLTGTNQFWHVTTSKPAGLSAIAAQDIDMAGNFTVTGGAPYGGTFDASGIYHRVGGNINVQAGAPAAIYSPATTLEHYGTAAATYFNAGFINSMTMNHTGPGLSLLTNMLMTASGTLTLNNGKIITNALRVEVNNRSLGAITAGNVNSYVENNSPAPLNSGLRKYLWNTGGAVGQYEFPVGTAAKGYQRMSWTVSAPWAASGSMNYCTVAFNNNWPTAGGSNAALGPECAAPNYHTGGALALDNGVWEVRPNAAATFNSAGNMDVTLYNRNYTNASVGYTVQYNKSGPITTAGNWLLNPFPTGCFGNPPITAVIRRGLAINTVLASFPLTAITYFNTAQTIVPLPVELLNFEARGLKNSISVKWATGSEIDNSGFELERTTTPPDNFEKIAWVEGHGSTSNANYYSHLDKDVQSGITYYYRLKQIDFNGNFEYSKIASGSIDGEVLGFAFHVIPNPYSGNTSITYTLKENAKVKIEVINTMGQQVGQLYNDNQEAGDYHYEFSAKASGFATGVYTVRVYIDEQIFTKRILETE